MLIAALSGRSLAQAARRAGYRPLVADLFGDLDTREFSEAVEVVAGGLAHGPRLPALLAALETLSVGRDPAGLVYGAGFEGRPRLLSSLAARWPLIGNDPSLIASLKNPFDFAKLCAARGIAHPDVRDARPPDPANWLIKRQGGSGGAHIRLARAARRRGPTDYYQRLVDGEATSVAFVSDGRRPIILGFTRQWTDPAPGFPFRFGGVVRVDERDVARRAEMRSAVEWLAACGLKGLNSADFLVARDRTWLLEVNPRPGASLDVIADRKGAVMAAHVEACRGKLPPAIPACDSIAAAAVVYASRTIASTPAIAWPHWAADRQRPGTRVGKGGPLCTVLAHARTAVKARQLVLRRVMEMRARLQGEC